MISILYFASLREQVGQASEQIEHQVNLKTVADVREYLCARGEPWSKVLASQTLVMMSVNQAMANANTQINDRDEIAFFPPVTGG